MGELKKRGFILRELNPTELLDELHRVLHKREDWETMGITKEESEKRYLRQILSFFQLRVS